MSDADWQAFHARWAGLTPPLRPDRDVVAAIAAAIAGHDARVLLLGVTPELAGLGRSLVALDWNPAMIADIWPGDRDGRTALLGDWRRAAVPGARFAAVIGDGSFNACPWPDDYVAICARLAALTDPGARLAVRFYIRPDEPEAARDLRTAVLDGTVGFHALKWRLAMMIAGAQGGPNVALATIHATFERLFPDRVVLARRAGYAPSTIAEIDAYRGSGTCFSFPTREEVLAVLPAAIAAPAFVDAGRYELAERCPILLARRA